MLLTVNGTTVEVPGTRAALLDVLAAAGMRDLRGVAIALDEEVVPRSNWAARQLHEGQRIEVVRASQGGAA
ncbi:MAG TPA: sulfur carrier protein ThiS [Actinomycetota bacterium]